MERRSSPASLRRTAMAASAPGLSFKRTSSVSWVMTRKPWSAERAQGLVVTVHAEHDDTVILHSLDVYLFDVHVALGKAACDPGGDAAFVWHKDGELFHGLLGSPFSILGSRFSTSAKSATNSSMMAVETCGMTVM